MGDDGDGRKMISCTWTTVREKKTIHRICKQIGMMMCMYIIVINITIEFVLYVFCLAGFVFNIF
jgi:hypothetical protein